MDKSWDYQELTLSAENRIRSLMEGKLTQERDWAFGVFLLWASLTSGYRKDSDSVRLEGLTAGKTED